MKTLVTLWVFFLLAFLSGVANAAGGPMNQDLTPLTATAQKALDAGKRGDAEAFVKEAEAALFQAKSQTDSAAQQRIVRKLKTAVSEGKAGKLLEGTQAVEEAMSDMKASGPPRFGGGS
ncbi:small metal-binding protein SmbP [Methylotetracoccus oryzae]|uniref:small metal-binding protein SmbP n=1 Tax=Methylotetracoccus oryzae TaxID=1919059 RepID=UPI0011197A2E|nr:small metal-binding protein SmbP [Methylotetracoccus oryzae]